MSTVISTSITDHPTYHETRSIPGTTPIRIMVVDDHAVIRAGLRMLIEQDQTMRVVSSVGTAAEALQDAQSLQPDIIVFDLLLGEEDGLNLASSVSVEEVARRTGRGLASADRTRRCSR